MMKEKMKQSFQQYQGGLFVESDKADVGDSYMKLSEQGVDLMGWADPFMPDYSLPEHVKEATIHAIESNVSAHYTAPTGNVDLRKKIACRFEKKYGKKIDGERNVIITPGSDGALYFAMLPFLERGDEVIVPSPCYPNNIQNIEMMQAKPVYYLLDQKNGYQIEKEKLEALVTDHTKMIVLTHPNNPTTTVYSEKSLKALREVVLKYDLVLVCDQAFEDFTYENQMIAPAGMDGMFSHTITIGSASKGYGLSGYRVGYIIASDEVMDVYYGCAVSVIGATNTVSQIALLAAMDDESFMQVFEKAYDYRRHKAVELFSDIPGVSIQLPQSGFLCWVDISGLGTSTEVCNRLLQEAKVSVNDGKNYGPNGEKGIRIVLGVYRDDEKVMDALQRIRKVLIEMSKEKGLM